MKFDPETLFISIIDLFSIMLPGALATALLKRAVEPILFPSVFPQFTGETAGWAAFLFASYLLGHFIFLFGSFLDDLLYDRLLRHARDEEVSLLKAIKERIDVVNKDGKIVLFNEISRLAQEAIKASKQDQKNLLEKFEKAFQEKCNELRNVTAKEGRDLAALNEIKDEIRKYKYWRKSFIHGVFKWFLRRTFSENPDLALNQALEIKKVYTPNANRKVVNTFQWAKAHLAIKCPTALVGVQRFEADSKFFRSLVVILVPLACWFFWKAFKESPNWLLYSSTGSVKSLLRLSEFKENPNWLLFLSCLVFGVLSIWRYAERRFKATQQAYWFVITVEGSLPPTADKH